MVLKDSDSLLQQIDNSVIKEILRTMLLVRKFEERVAELAYLKEFGCPVHLDVGQEAIAVGVSLHLNHTDYSFGTHRGHGHYVAKGGSINRLMAEIYGRETGCSHGHGGSMHIVEPEVGFMGCSAIVAGTIPLAVGAALTAKYNDKKQISVAFFGDGATDEGIFYESINLATLYKLPIVFICENNSFSTHMPDFLRQSNTKVFERIKGFNLPTRRVDGNNSLEVYRNAEELIDETRNGSGPSLMECMTYRWLAHVGPEPDIDIGYRKKEDIDHWKSRCPIKALKELMVTEGIIDDSDYTAVEKKIVEEVEASVAFAKSSPFPSKENIARGVF